jgi:hypothetical protein
MRLSFLPDFTVTKDFFDKNLFLDKRDNSHFAAALRKKLQQLFPGGAFSNKKFLIVVGIRLNIFYREYIFSGRLIMNFLSYSRILLYASQIKAIVFALPQ